MQSDPAGAGGFPPYFLALVAPFRLRNIVLLSFLLAGGILALGCCTGKLDGRRLGFYRWLLISTAALILLSIWAVEVAYGRFPLGPSPVLGARFYGLGK